MGCLPCIAINRCLFIAETVSIVSETGVNLTIQVGIELRW